MPPPPRPGPARPAEEEAEGGRPRPCAALGSRGPRPERPPPAWPAPFGALPATGKGRAYFAGPESGDLPGQGVTPGQDVLGKLKKGFPALTSLPTRFQLGAGKSDAFKRKMSHTWRGQKRGLCPQTESGEERLHQREVTRVVLKDEGGSAWWRRRSQSTAQPLFPLSEPPLPSDPDPETFQIQRQRPLLLGTQVPALFPISAPRPGLLGSSPASIGPGEEEPVAGNSHGLV